MERQLNHFRWARRAKSIDERTHLTPGTFALVEPRHRERPVVLHALADPHARGTSAAARSGGDAHRIVEQDLILARKHEQRWESRQIRKHR